MDRPRVRDKEKGDERESKTETETETDTQSEVIHQKYTHTNLHLQHGCRVISQSLAPYL